LACLPPVKENTMAVPSTAKKPADHAAKAEAKGEDITFDHDEVTYTIERDVVDDVEVLELIGDMTENPILLPKVVHTMLGPDQWAAFKDAHRNAKGRVPSDELNRLFETLDNAVGKSQP
jgi:hypothetical protein